jgi:hypothetical protein
MNNEQLAVLLSAYRDLIEKALLKVKTDLILIESPHVEKLEAMFYIPGLNQKEIYKIPILEPMQEIIDRIGCDIDLLLKEKP